MLIAPLIILLVILLFRVLVRRTRVAVGLVFVLFALFTILQAPQFPHTWPVALVLPAIVRVVLIRFGLLATIVAFLFSDHPLWLPVTSDLSSWYAGPSFLSLALMAALAAYGFCLSLAGRSLLAGADILGD
jgi:hypothetical protein